ncbi:MAG: flagellar motor protein MotB [Desulforegulaceae bacterium]|nr:flagellar motor protein MotB [Desulforegulaceae bacterium]
MAEENSNTEEEKSFGLSEGNSSSNEECSPGAPAWMATFADLVTLLMCFFVLLFAMSTIQEETFKELVQSLRSALGVQTIPEAGTREGLVMQNARPDESKPEKQSVDEIGTMIQKEIKDIVSDVKELVMFNQLAGMVDVKETEEGAVITISDLILFRTGQAEITEEGLDILVKIIAVLKQFRYPIEIAGHTDNVPIDTNFFPSNWELSSRRATEVVRFFVEKGLDPRLLSAAGYASFRPVDTNDTPSGRAKNRRVEIVYRRQAIENSLYR